MKLTAVLAVAVASLSFVSAEDTNPLLTYTYQSFAGGRFITTSTVYPLYPLATTGTDGIVTITAHTTVLITICTPTHNPLPTSSTAYGHMSSHGVASSTPTSISTSTSYSLNSSALAYPTFPVVNSTVANAAPGPGLMNATQFGAEAVELIYLLKNATTANCNTCKTIMTSLAAAMKAEQDLLSDMVTPLCNSLSAFLSVPICIGLLKTGSEDIGGVFPAMNMTGDVGQTLCAFMFGVFTLPPVPKLDLQSLFKRTTKPAPRPLTISSKSPLKVLHISDYHLDMRYV